MALPPYLTTIVFPRSETAASAMVMAESEKSLEMAWREVAEDDDVMVGTKALEDATKRDVASRDRNFMILLLMLVEIRRFRRKLLKAGD